jgi:hypothetical protein
VDAGGEAVVPDGARLTGACSARPSTDKIAHGNATTHDAKTVRQRFMARSSCREYLL